MGHRLTVMSPGAKPTATGPFEEHLAKIEADFRPAKPPTKLDATREVCRAAVTVDEPANTRGRSPRARDLRRA